MLETEESVDSHHILQEAPDRVIKRSPPTCDSGSTELDLFDIQGTFQGGRLE